MVEYWCIELGLLTEPFRCKKWIISIKLIDFQLPLCNFLFFYKANNQNKGKQKDTVRSGIRTHVSIRRQERPLPLCARKVFNLKSGALDRSAILTTGCGNYNILTDHSMYSFLKHKFQEKTRGSATIIWRFSSHLQWWDDVNVEEALYSHGTVFSGSEKFELKLWRIPSKQDTEKMQATVT